MTEQELIYNIHRNIEDLYMLEDDALFIRDNVADYESYGYDSEEDAEAQAECYENEAHQIYHVIKSDLAELSGLLGRKIKMEDFTEGEFKS